MAQDNVTIPPVEPMPVAKQTDAPPERLVRHCFWKYPLLAFVLFVVIIIVAALVGSPNWPRDTIASVSRQDPGGAVLAFTQELAGDSISTENATEYGMGYPGDVFAHNPLHQAAWFLGPAVQAALNAFDAANPQQRVAWARNYEHALATITPMASGSGMTVTPSPDYSKISTLKGDFGPIPVMVAADLRLAQNGYLEQYLQTIEPGHAYHLTNIWLYDHPQMLNTAVQQGLTDDQWGMVKERGFPVGPWYLIIPAVFHVKFPGGSNGPGFVLWNLLFAFFLLFIVPLVPGIRDLPRYLKLYRFIYRYPVKGELEKPLYKERHGSTHGGVEVAAGGGE